MRKNLPAAAVILCILAAFFLIVPVHTARAFDLNRDALDLKVGETYTVNAVPVAQDMPVTWTIRNREVAEITWADNSHAIVRGRKMGETELVARTKWGGRYVCNITVFKPKNRVLYKKGGVTIKTTGASITDYREGRLRISIRNTTKKTVAIYYKKMTINGHYIGDGYVCDVPRQAQVRENIICSFKKMKSYDIKNIRRARLVIQVRDVSYEKLGSKKVNIRY